MKNILAKYEIKGITIEIKESTDGYDVIFYMENSNGYFLKNEPLAVAFAFVAGYMYECVKSMEGGIM